MAERLEEAERKYLTEKCILLLVSKDFGYTEPEARGICSREKIKRAINTGAKYIIEGVMEEEDVLAELSLRLGTEVEPKPKPPPTIVPTAVPVVEGKTEKHIRIAEKIFSEYPKMLLTSSMVWLQKRYGASLDMLESDIPGVSGVLEELLAREGEVKMEKAKRGRDYFAGWILKTKASSIVTGTLRRSIRTVLGELINAYRDYYPGTVEEVGGANLELALNGYVMENLGVSREDMPKDIPPAIAVYERGE